MPVRSKTHSPCEWSEASVERFDHYFETHPADAAEIRAAMNNIASGPREIGEEAGWQYMGIDLPDTIIYPVNESVVILYQIVETIPDCRLGLVGILDIRDP